MNAPIGAPRQKRKTVRVWLAGPVSSARGKRQSFVQSHQRGFFWVLSPSELRRGVVGM